MQCPDLWYWNNIHDWNACVYVCMCMGVGVCQIMILKEYKRTLLIIVNIKYIIVDDTIMISVWSMLKENIISDDYLILRVRWCMPLEYDIFQSNHSLLHIKLKRTPHWLLWYPNYTYAMIIAGVIVFWISCKNHLLRKSHPALTDGTLFLQHIVRKRPNRIL